MDVHNPDGHEVHGSSPVNTTDALNEHWHQPGDPDGVIAREQAQRETAERAARIAQRHNQPAPLKTKRRKHRFLHFCIGVAVMVAATYGVFWFGDFRAKQDAKPATPRVTQPKVAVKPSTSVKHYESATYLVGIDYPSDWTVTDTATALKLVSPTVQLKTTGGKQVAGHVVVALQNKQTTIAGYPAGGALAALPSEKLTYKQPTMVQRAQTYLSYTGYADNTAIHALYITGDNGYTQDQYIPLSDVIKGDPLVSVTFATCTSTDCATGATPVTLSTAAWANFSYRKQVFDILTSLQLN